MNVDQVSTLAAILMAGEVGRVGLSARSKDTERIMEAVALAISIVEESSCQFAEIREREHAAYEKPEPTT